MIQNFVWRKESFRRVFAGGLALSMVIGGLLSFNIAIAANTPTLTQAISEGTLAVDIVNSGGASVANPSVAFSSFAFSYEGGTSSATLGTSDQKVRVSNPRNTSAWSLTLAANSAGATWSDGGTNSYDYKGTSETGQMTVNPSVGTVTAINAGSSTRCDTTAITKGGETAFSSSQTSVTLMSAGSGAKNNCRFDLTGVGISQAIPPAQPGGTYSLSMVLSVL